MGVEETGRVGAGKRWKGFLASLLFSGAGQYLSGARRRGIIWAITLFFGPPLFIIAYNQPLMPAKSWLVAAATFLALWFVMLADSFRPVRSLRWWLCLVLLAASIGLSQGASRILNAIYRAYRVPVAGMSPTLKPGDLLLVSKIAYFSHEPSRGDLVVFTTRDIPDIPQAQGKPDILYLKRIVGMPGDRLDFENESISVNNQTLRFSDAAPAGKFRRTRGWFRDRDSEAYVIPANYYFMVGDNAANSYDSRFWGPVRREAIIGRVTKVYWPLDRICAPH